MNKIINSNSTNKLSSSSKERRINSGSTKNQIWFLEKRIKNLTFHFKKNKKDYHSRLGLLKIVNKRKKLVSYLKNKKRNFP
jgi:small subunit ribosomal protein S15